MGVTGEAAERRFPPKRCRDRCARQPRCSPQRQSVLSLDLLPVVAVEEVVQVDRQGLTVVARMLDATPWVSNLATEWEQVGSEPASLSCRQREQWHIRLTGRASKVHPGSSTASPSRATSTTRPAAATVPGRAMAGIETVRRFTDKPCCNRQTHQYPQRSCSGRRYSRSWLVGSSEEVRAENQSRFTASKKALGTMYGRRTTGHERERTDFGIRHFHRAGRPGGPGVGTQRAG